MLEIRRRPTAAAGRIATGAAVLLALPGLAGAGDRSAPTTPTNVRVTAMTPYSATLAWDASKDRSGVARYVICCADTNSMNAPGNVTSFVYTAGLHPGYSFTLHVWAVDGAGNYSKPSNGVTFTPPRDTVPPAKPLVSVTGVGTRHVSLLWSATDEDPRLRYCLSMGERPLYCSTPETSTVLTLLSPETTYTFTVKALDSGGNWSPLSDPVTATTSPVNSADVTPPTTPSLGGGGFGDCEAELYWSESTDDLDPQWLIEYQVFINGVYDHSTSQRHLRTIVYGTRNGANTFGVVAVDTAGNRSEMAEVTFDLVCP